MIWFLAGMEGFYDKECPAAMRIKNVQWLLTIRVFVLCGGYLTPVPPILDQEWNV
jgi:hypothetical protein